MPEKDFSKKLVFKKIGIVSLAKIYTVLMAIMGLIIGVFYVIIGAAASATGQGTPGLAGLGILAIIITPIVYGIMGFLMGIIGGWLFNLITGWIGGIEMEFESR